MKKRNRKGLLISLFFLLTAVSCAPKQAGSSSGSSLFYESDFPLSENAESSFFSETVDPENARLEAIENLNRIFSSLDLTLYGHNGNRMIQKIYDEEIAAIENMDDDSIFLYDISSFLSKIQDIPTLSNAKKTDLFISEVFNIGYDKDRNPDGNNNDKAIELYNPTDVSISLSDYILELYGNGSDSIKSEDYRILLQGILDPHTAYVIVNQYASEKLKLKADWISPVYLGAKSSVALYKNGTLLDVFGTIGASYSSNDEFAIDGISSASELHNLIRKAGVVSSYEFIDSQWKVSFDADYSTLGTHVFSEDAFSASEALNALVEYWFGKEITGNIELITNYRGYRFSYDFYGYYYDENGQMLIEPDDGFELCFSLSVLDEDGRILETSYDGYVIYRKGV